MLGLLCGLVSMSWQTRFIVNSLIYYALFSIVALSLSFMYGRAGVPFLGCSVPVLAGGLMVSAVTTRLAFAAAGAAGVELLPYLSENDWVYNSEENVALVDEFLGQRPLLCVALVVFTLAASMCGGAAAGWLVSKPALGMLSGGTMGVFVPDLLAFSGVEKSYVVLGLSMLALLGVFLILRTVKRSPFGRLMVAVRDDPVAAASLGKDVASVRSRVVAVACGLMALAGALVAFYFTFVVQANYHNALWNNWPLLMVVVGGSGSDAGALLGVALVDGLRRLIILNKAALTDAIFFPIAYLEQLIYSVLMLVFLILRPRGLLGEKPTVLAMHRRVIEEHLMENVVDDAVLE